MCERLGLEIGQKRQRSTSFQHKRNGCSFLGACLEITKTFSLCLLLPSWVACVCSASAHIVSHRAWAVTLCKNHSISFIIVLSITPSLQPNPSFRYALRLIISHLTIHFALSAPLWPFILGRRRRPTHGTPLGQGMCSPIPRMTHASSKILQYVNFSWKKCSAGMCV